ncbi:hypothetical protein CU098_001640, partial [Rhizopus stolonifer]
AESLTVKAPRSNWFISPDAAQLAADTFRRPVAVYTESNYSEMFFPLLNTDVFHRTTEGSEATLPMPMILQITEDALAKTLYASPGKGISYKRSDWSRYLPFYPRR